MCLMSLYSLWHVERKCIHFPYTTQNTKHTTHNAYYVCHWITNELPINIDWFWCNESLRDIDVYISFVVAETLWCDWLAHVRWEVACPRLRAEWKNSDCLKMYRKIGVNRAAGTDHRRWKKLTKRNFYSFSAIHVSVGVLASCIHK